VEKAERGVGATPVLGVATAATAATAAAATAAVARARAAVARASAMVPTLGGRGGVRAARAVRAVAGMAEVRVAALVPTPGGRVCGGEDARAAKAGRAAAAKEEVRAAAMVPTPGGRGAARAARAVRAVAARAVVRAAEMARAVERVASGGTTMTSGGTTMTSGGTTMTSDGTTMTTTTTSEGTTAAAATVEGRVAAAREEVEVGDLSRHRSNSRRLPRHRRKQLSCLVPRRHPGKCTRCTGARSFRWFSPLHSRCHRHNPANMVEMVGKVGLPVGWRARAMPAPTTRLPVQSVEAQAAHSAPQTWSGPSSDAKEGTWPSTSRFTCAFMAHMARCRARPRV